jgi:pimeloyl-ACP methyl ester carboxylesterase
MMLTLVSAAATGLVVGGGAYVMDRVALSMIRPPPKPIRRRASRLPFENRRVTFMSGAVELVGWVIEPEVDGGKAVVIVAHGWGSNHGSMTRLAEPLLEAGHPVLLFDIRFHGESRGAPYVTARHFRDDILAACQEAGRQFPGRARVLVGHSMGGSAGVVAVAEGAPVEGLVSIAAPADLWDVWAYHLDQKFLPGRWVVRALTPFWRVRAGVPFRTLDPEARGRELMLPVLVLHGELDESVKVGHAEKLARAMKVEPRILQGQGHSDLLESPELHVELLSFLEAIDSAWCGAGAADG